MNNEYYELTATQLIEKVQNKELSVFEIAKSFVQRYEDIESKLNAWASYDKDLYLKIAKEVDEKIANQNYKLEDVLLGLPMGVKDCYNSENFKTKRGSLIYENYMPGNDARIIRKARDFGAIVIGKTETAEFSIHKPSKTVNPHNAKHTPGTSSGGSAAAVATGMVPVAFGTQTAASTSKPASYCGVYGFKPTFGLLPRTGVLKTSDTLDTLSFFSRTIDDLELLFNVLRLRGDDHPFIKNNIDLEEKIEKERIVFFKPPTFSEKPKYAKDAFLDFANELENALNCKIDILDTPTFLNHIHHDHNKIYSKSVSYYFDYEYSTFKEKISKITCEMIELGKSISKNDYCELISKQADTSYVFDQWMQEHYDFAFVLASAEEAPEGLDFNDKADSSLMWTYLGVPLLVAPKFLGPNGLPFGFQIISRKYTDNHLFRFAKKLEQKCIIKTVPVIGVS